MCAVLYRNRPEKWNVFSKRVSQNLIAHQFLMLNEISTVHIKTNHTGESWRLQIKAFVGINMRELTFKLIYIVSLFLQMHYSDEFQIFLKSKFYLLIFHKIHHLAKLPKLGWTISSFWHSLYANPPKHHFCNQSTPHIYSLPFCSKVRPSFLDPP